MRRWILMVGALLGAVLRVEAAPAGDKAFESAYNAFQDTAFARAEEEFAKFAQIYTNSPRLPQAILFQARARLQQTNYAGAIELLVAQQAQAGEWAHEYLFWLAKANAQKGDDLAASTNFARLIQQFPSSSHCLEAAISQATAFSRLGQWDKVVELLQATNGVFRNAVRTNSSSELTLQGHLLLGEGLLALQRYLAAELALKPLGNQPLAPDIDWQRQYLLCRIALADQRPDEALGGTTNLLSLAVKAANRGLQAQSAAFRGSVFERLGQADEAIATYNANLGDAFPSRYQRQALLKITQISLAQDRFLEAGAALEKFLTRFPGAPDADAALLGVAELLLQQHRLGLCTNVALTAATNTPGATNCLDQATLKLRELASRFPQSSLLGKAYLALGWCFWEQGNMPPAQTNFQAALERLPPSTDLAVAHFKLGDAQFRQKDFAGALTNYNLLIDKFGASEEVKTNLLEPALYQCVQAALAVTNLPAATNAMAKIQALFPTGFHTERAVLLAGQQVRQQGNPGAAQRILLNFARRATNSPLLPQIQLAVARTYEDLSQWTNAVTEYSRWLAAFSNNPARPLAEFFHARATLLAGSKSDALVLLTNFIAHFPTHELAPLARFSVADHYFQAGKFSEAEVNYQLVFQNTNWPVSELTWQAMMMAGGAAVEQQGWSGARDYFSKLYQSAVCPAALRADALIAYGDTWLGDAGSSPTNRIFCYSNAIQAYNAVAQAFPSNRVAVAAARGNVAGALLQWAQDAPEYYPAASNAFREVILMTNAEVAARSAAKVGLAIVQEKQADLKPDAADKIPLLKLALANCQDVFYENVIREGEEADLYWIRESGLRAGRLAEALNQWPMARKVYERLRDRFPGLRAKLEKAIRRCEEHSATVAN